VAHGRSVRGEGVLKVFKTAEGIQVSADSIEEAAVKLAAYEDAKAKALSPKEQAAKARLTEVVKPS